MKTIPALFTLVAATIGIGVLALPYTLSKSGVLPGISLLVIAFILTVTINLLYVEVLLHVKGKHQFAGYAGMYFGKIGKVIATIALLIGAYGACLAYIVQAGIFLETAFPAFSAFYYSLAFFGVIAMIGLMNMKLFAEIQSIMVGILLLLLTGLCIVGFRYVSLDNYALVGKTFSDVLLPYGVLLFAFSGYSIIPELGEITQYDRKSLKKAVLVGTGIVAVVYVVFSFIIIGISGDSVSEDAIVGLTNTLGSGVVKYIALAALFPVTTSFISLSRVSQDLFVSDLKMVRPVAWFLSLYPPLILFLSGRLGIVKILEISGGITVGLTGSLLIAMFLKMATNKHVLVTRIKKIVYISVAMVFILGIAYELSRGL